MNSNGFKVDIRLAARPGPVKAHADLRLTVPGGELLIYGFSLIQKEGKPLFVGFPSKPGSMQGKYFRVFDAEGQVREEICKAILDAYRELGTRQ